MIFKNAGLIPNTIRPSIFVTLDMRLDNYMFNLWRSFSGSVLSLFGIVSGSWLLYLRFYNDSKICSKCDYNNDSNSERSSDISIDLKENEELFELFDLGSNATNSSIVEDLQDNIHYDSLEFFDKSSPSTIVNQTSIINNKIIQRIKEEGTYKPLNCWYFAPPLLLASSWFILNFDYWFKEPINTPKDLIAWFFYVLGHFLAPLFTGIWLYVFHAPGALKLFSFALGMQNIAGVLTHLSFPNTPPWFIHYYGENYSPNYDMSGYAAGLTRVDIAFGTHINSAGFHASPIVFGALPSLHSAMAVMVFFFVSYYSRWTSLKIIALSFVVLQWWATIYLDHHWRLDLILGLIYSIVSFTILKSWKKGLSKVDEDFIKARLRFDFKNGSTMGMRVFRNTNIQNFFDPLS